ncbi:MAG: enoyl-CoA hydratase/isomerase family protein [Vannielia sp.]|uniref:enoyl-CoA hydratase/isomerase family protein n=1 Tax=Vannielia sp. TaxID=2813045 RepID=UPI003B8C37D7
MTGTLVLSENHGPVAVLTLNRPEKLNALSPELLEELRGQLDAIAAEGEAVRAVVLRGAGRSFCAGADVEALKAGVVTEDPEARSKTVQRLGEIAPVVIAAVHGHCVTGGLELALAADVIVAAETARFRDTHARLGIVPRWGMSVRLPRRVGLATARRISLTCAEIGAEEALRIGLCDMVVPEGELIATAMALAGEAARSNPASVAAISTLYEAGLHLPLAEALDAERAFTPRTVVRGEAV